MDENKLGSTKKCPFCQQWSEWAQQPDDRCQHCGHLLDPRASHQARQDAAAAHQRAAARVQLIEIRPEDGALLRLLKRVGRGGQLLFMGIVGLVVWLVTALTL